MGTAEEEGGAGAAEARTTQEEADHNEADAAVPLLSHLGGETKARRVSPLPLQEHLLALLETSSRRRMAEMTLKRKSASFAQAL